MEAGVLAAISLITPVRRLGHATVLPGAVLPCTRVTIQAPRSQQFWGAGLVVISGVGRYFGTFNPGISVATAGSLIGQPQGAFHIIKALVQRMQNTN